MAAKTRELTAYGARKKKFLRRDFGDLEVQVGVRDVTSPIAVLGITDFGNNRDGVDSTFEAKDSKKKKSKAKDRLFEYTPSRAKDRNGQGQGPRAQFFKLWWVNFS